ncbi:hypothetical protein KTU59_23195, partial [Escherichia coli]|nr:hypothetical protein [Escherichia coli]
MELKTTAIDNVNISKLKNKTKLERRRLLVKRFLFNKSVLIGTIILLFLTLFALFAPLITPHSPLAMENANRLQPPSSEHWFGTDNFGRDLFSRVANGAQVSLTVG